MTGYDRKRLQLSHHSSGPVRFTIEINFDHGAWHRLESIDVPVGDTVTYKFPQGFHAHWCRLTSNVDCRATATFLYD